MSARAAVFLTGFVALALATPGRTFAGDSPPPVPLPDPTAPPPTIEGPFPSEDLPVEEVPAVLPPVGPEWHGSIALRYRFRSTDDDHDSDLYEYLSLHMRDDTQPGWSATLHGRLAEDLDGGGDSGEFFVFDSVEDSYVGRVTGRVYHAFANWRACPGAPGIEEVRIGRQTVDAGDGYLIDGIRATTAPLDACHETRVSAFVGIPAHLYEDSAEGDFIGGLAVSGRPWRGAEARVDWAHVEDDNEFYGTPVDDIFTAEIHQRFGTYTRARAWYRQIDEHPRFLGVAADSVLPSRDVTLRGTFKTQLEREEALVIDVDPFYAVANALEPYWQAGAAVSKGLGDRFTVEGGADVRRLWDSADEGTFNREWERVYATVSTWDWPACGVGLTLTGEYWTGHDEYATAAFEVEWKPSRIWRLVAGTDYAMYRTDLYTNTERVDSRGWYVRAAWSPRTCWRFDFSFRLEDDDFDTYATLQAGVRFEF
jgi:hypothetical protein